MKKMSALLQKPMGQVLAATVLFCFIYIALFSGLYRAGTAYMLKERGRRGADLTSLSAGAVYANGLRLVQYSNIVLMMVFASDIGAIGLKISPLIPGLPEDLPLVLATAKAADPNHRREWQEVQSFLFGVPLENGSSSRAGLDLQLPLEPIHGSIELQAHSTAGDNQLKNNLILPCLFYNIETTKNLGRAVLPDMALRFRRAGEILSDSPPAGYSLEHDGQKYYFTQDQVEPAQNPRLPGQMRVRQDYPSPFSGMWVHSDKDGSNSDDFDHFVSHFPFGPATAKALQGFLDKVLLDVTHRDDPPNHTLALLNQLPGKAGGTALNLTQTTEVTVEGGGLAAWDIQNPPFKSYLKKLDPGDFPGMGPWIQLQKAADSGFSDLKNQLGFLGGAP